MTERAKRFVYYGFIALVFAAFAVAAYYLVFGNPPAVQSKPAEPPKRIEALGRIEPVGGVMNIGLPMGDRIEQVLVKEGDDVKEGQELARMQSHGARLAEKNLAATQYEEARNRRSAIAQDGAMQIDEARLKLRQAEELGPLDIQALESQVKLHKDQLETAEKNLERLQGLRSISPQELEQQKLLVQKVKTELTSTERQRDKAVKGLELNVAAARAHLKTIESTIDRLKLEVPVETAAKSLAAAEERLRNSVITAPTPGRILKVYGRAGEAASQPLLQMANTSKMQVVAEVYETDVRYLQIGQEAKITSKALDKDLTGKVDFIGTTIGKNRIMDINPLADADRRVVEVKIALGSNDLAARYVNLQVNVVIDLK